VGLVLDRSGGAVLPAFATVKGPVQKPLEPPTIITLALLLAGCALPFDYPLHCPVIIPSHLLIRHTAIPLGGADVSVAQKVLEGG